ncbi:uncharacterized protein LOC129760566, partial [Uranotaenia lowii]|uniref:uncharacterized protein LOC129760566 n=1 Tax=Uranotaenia lowii TaxID=190385 RepID=UPI00247A85A9
HGADVKCVHWHPQKGLIVSGSKDNQQPIKLWDPKTGQALATLHAHKSTVMDLKWNDNGNWLVTASRDHLLKLFDLRNLSEEVQVFRGHKKEASAVSWHPIHEGLFASGGSDGSILFWNVGTDKEVGGIDNAHESIVWTLAWHPLGHILCSGSNDHTIKFWTRNRPGDQMRDKYNLNTLPASLAGLDECELEDHVVIPGMGPEDKIDIADSLGTNNNGVIPGLDFANVTNFNDKMREKKIPYSKPIPRNFQAQWNEASKYDEPINVSSSEDIKDVITHIADTTLVSASSKMAPSAIILYDRVIPVQPCSDLENAILDGREALHKYILMGLIPEIHDIIPPITELDLLSLEQNGVDEYASRANLEIDPTFIYNKSTTSIEPSEPPDATEPLLSSTSLIKRRSPPPPPDPTAGIPSLLQLDIFPPPNINFSTDEREDEMALRNSKKGREREKAKEQEIINQEQEMRHWAEHNDVNWDDEMEDGPTIKSEPAFRQHSPEHNSNGKWSSYDNDGADAGGLGGDSWEQELNEPKSFGGDRTRDSNSRDGPGNGFQKQQSSSFNFNQGPPPGNFGGPNTFGSFNPNAGPNTFGSGPGSNTFNRPPNTFSQPPNSFNQGPNTFGNNFNPNLPPGPPPNFTGGPPPNFNAGPPGSFNPGGPPPGNFNAGPPFGNFHSGPPPPNNFNNFNNGGGNNFDGGNDDWVRNNRGGRGNMRGGRGRGGFRGGGNNNNWRN